MVAKSSTSFRWVTGRKVTTAGWQVTLCDPMVAKSSTSFRWVKGRKVTTAGWQVTLCDPIWHVISHSGVVISITNCYLLPHSQWLYLCVNVCLPATTMPRSGSSVTDSLTSVTPVASSVNMSNNILQLSDVKILHCSTYWELTVFTQTTKRHSLSMRTCNHISHSQLSHSSSSDKWLINTKKMSSQSNLGICCYAYMSGAVWEMLMELKADMASFAGNTVWSVSERCEAGLSLLVALYKFSAF